MPRLLPAFALALTLAASAAALDVISAQTDYNPPPLSPGASVTRTIGFGAACVLVGDFAAATFSHPLGDVALDAQISADGAATATFRNLGAGNVNLPLGTLVYYVIPDPNRAGCVAGKRRP